METECSGSEIGKHCFHNSMCCWCGQINFFPQDDSTPHGPHKWLYPNLAPAKSDTATINLYPLNNTNEPCMIEEFFKQNPGSTSCLIACPCWRHRVICTY